MTPYVKFLKGLTFQYRNAFQLRQSNYINLKIWDTLSTVLIVLYDLLWRKYFMKAVTKRTVMQIVGQQSSLPEKSVISNSNWWWASAKSWWILELITLRRGHRQNVFVGQRNMLLRFILNHNYYSNGNTSIMNHPIMTTS